MRISPLHEQFKNSGASFVNRHGTEVATSVHDSATEYRYVRDSVGLTDFSHMQKFRIPEETGLDFLDSLVAGNVAKIRFGRVLHTFLPDSNGMLTADCYIANNDDELIVLCESIQDDSSIRSLFMANSEETGVEDLTDSQVVIGIDGYKAWAVAKKIFGSDILGLPYLSIESYAFEDTDIRLIRAGKTSEFGYLLIAPKEIGPALYDALLDAVKEQGGGLCGADTHNNLRLEGRFFNIYSEGAAVLDPLPLGLQWMIDFDKDGYTGHDSIMERRKNGLQKKIIGINVPKGVSFEPGMAIYDGSKKVAEVKACCFSYILDSVLGLALFDIEGAFSGLTFNLNSPDGPQVKTVSMPPIIPKSLTVKLDEI